VARCIDVHSHFLPASVLDRLRRDGDRWRTPVQTRADGKVFVVTPERPYGPIGPGFHDLDVRKRYMAEQGIARQVLAPPPFLFYYWIDARTGLEIIREVNDATAEITNADPAFAGLGTIPMQDATSAVRECERIKAIGLCGVEIGSNIDGMELDDERLWPVYEAIEALGLPVLVHPNNVVGSDRMHDFHLQNLVGFPSDSTLAAARLIFAGILDRFPRLKICLGQAGGFLPYIIGRLDQGFTARAECRRSGCSKPSDYLRRFHYDTIIHAPRPLAFLIESVGADRVMFGSDFPFDMRSMLPTTALDADGSLTPEQSEQIRLGTGEQFFGLRKPALIAVHPIPG
jgi:aminocarboxymuconate-semialdehyde decarboxylase